jgi:hypothetical protein
MVTASNSARTVADGTNIRPVTRTTNWDGLPDWGPK